MEEGGGERRWRDERERTDRLIYRKKIEIEHPLNNII